MIVRVTVHLDEGETLAGALERAKLIEADQVTIHVPPDPERRANKPIPSRVLHGNQHVVIRFED